MAKATKAKCGHPRLNKSCGKHNCQNKVEIEGFASKVLEEAMRLVETLFADMNSFHEVRTASTNQTIAFATNASPNTFGVKPVDNRVAKMSKVLEQFTDNME